MASTGIHLLKYSWKIKRSKKKS